MTLRAFVLVCLLLCALPVAARGEPRLEAGFPAEAFLGPGTYSGTGATAITVGDIDGDPLPEIVVPSVFDGPLYAWNGDGSTVAGWPRADTEQFAYPALGQLTTRAPGFEVVLETDGSYGQAWARTGDGARIGGWPRRVGGAWGSGAALADLDGDGLDEMITHDGDNRLLVRDATGRTRMIADTADGRTPPIVVDLDNDGALEIVSPGMTSIEAHEADGSRVAGWGWGVQVAGVRPYPATTAAAGDVDGDGRVEIVLQYMRDEPGNQDLVVVLDHNGAEQWRASVPEQYSSTPSLGDLDDDGVPEIVIEGLSTVTAFRGDGTRLPGFPVEYRIAERSVSNGALIADVTGDRRPEIITTSSTPSPDPESATVNVFDGGGERVPGAQIDVGRFGPDIHPAVADVDGDGRNEILVAARRIGAYVSWTPYLYAYDLGGAGPHAPPEWGQYAGGPQHQGRYGAPTTPPLAGEEAVAGALAEDVGDAAVLGDTLLFASGGELWASDGTTAALVKDIRPGAAGSDPRSLVAAGDQVFFTADDGTTGVELWRSDGTASGTRRVADIWPGAEGSKPLELAAIGDELWFAAWDGEHGYEPWHSDGTEAGTVMLDDLIVGSGATDHGSGAGSQPSDFTADGDRIWFRATTADSFSQMLVHTDGTADGTVAVRVTGNPIAPFTPGGVAVAGGEVFFHNGDNLVHGDGTAAGTPPLPNYPKRLIGDVTTLGAGVVYAAADLAGGGDRTLWRDVAGGEPTPLGDLWPEGDENPSGLLAVGDRVVFAVDSETGREPWVTDGTTATQLTDLRPGARGSDPVILAALGDDRVLLAADNGTHGHELWVSGVKPGTAKRLTDLAPGAASATIRWVRRLGDRLLVSTGAALHTLAVPVPVTEPEPTPTTTPDATATPTTSPSATATPSATASTTPGATATPGATTTPDATATAPPTTSRDTTATASPAPVAQPAPTPQRGPLTPARVTTARLASTSVRRGRALTLTLAASGPLTVRITVDDRTTKTVKLTTRTHTVRVSTRGLKPGRHTLRAGTRTLIFRVARL